MGIVYATSKRTGKTYSVSVAGNAATPDEEAQINAYVDQLEGVATAPAVMPEGQEDEGTNPLIDFGKGAASGFARSFADIPGGLASLTAAGLSYIPGDQGESEIEDFGQGITDYARTGIDYVLGTPNDSVASKSGQAIGSLASFLVPFAGGAKVASALGAGTKAMRATGAVSSGTMGVALGAQNQVDRIARVLEEGGEVDKRELAILFGGGIGATEAFPLGRVFGSVANLLKKVPKDAKEEAVDGIVKRLKNAGVAGLAEGGQEVVAAILQDLTEKKMYNPDLELSASAYQDDAIYGGGAGATFNFLLETIGGRRVKKVIDARKELLADQAAESQEVRDQVERAKASSLSPEAASETVSDDGEVKPLQLVAPKEDTEKEADVTENTAQYIKELKDLRDQDQVNNADQERTAQLNAQRQLNTGFNEIDLSTLPKEIALLVSQSRVRSGSDIDAGSPTTIKELETILPDGETKNRIIQTEKNRQKPDVEPLYQTPEQKEEQAAKQESDKKVTDNLSTAKVAVETGRATNKDGTISRPKLQRELRLNAIEAQAVIDKLARQGIIQPIKRDKKDNLVYEPVLPEKTLEEAVPTPEEQRVQEFESNLNQLRANKAKAEAELLRMKQTPPQTQQEQLDLEQQERLVNDIGGRVNLQENGLRRAQAAINPDTKSPVQLRANDARSAVAEAPQAMPTDEHKRNLNRIANVLRRYLANIGLNDVTLTTSNVLEFGEQTEMSPAFIVEGQEEKGTDGKRIITLAMEIYDPNMPDAVLEQRLAGVLNHEIIHSMKRLGLFTDAEYASLVKAAESRRYVTNEGGVKKQRKYTFLDRSEHMYPDLDPEGQQEEAVAEMFRAYADGRLKMVGKPKSIFGRMVKFIKGIFGAYNDAGFTDVDAIFSGISSGKIGRRVRAAQSDVTRQSRRTDFQRSQDFLTNLKDFIITNPDGFTVTIDGSLTPKRGYAVAPLKQTETKSAEKEFDIDDVLDQVDNILRLQQSYKGIGIDIRTYAGGWFNPKEGVYVLDASVILDDRAEALYVGKAGGQDAIADLGAINQGDFDNAIIETDRGIEGLKSDGIYRDELANVARTNHAKLVEGFEKLRVQDKERREVYTDADVDRVRVDREPDDAQAPKLSRRISSINVPNVNSIDADRISQRLPTAVSATEDGINNAIRMELSDLLADDKLKARAAQLIRNYNIITEQEAENATDEELIEILTERLSDNLEFVYDNVDPQTRERSKLWYIGANRIANEIAKKYGLEVRQVAGVMAALSPQKDWYQNVSLAERTIDIKMTKMDIVPTPEMLATARRIFSKDQYQPMLNIIFQRGRNMPLSEYKNAPLLEAMFIRIYDETYNDRGYQIVSPDGEDLGFARNKNGKKRRAAWGSNKEVTKAGLAISDPDSIVLEMGDRHKVRNFYNNIIAPESLEGDVTSDTHAVAAAHLKPLSGASTEVHHNFGTAPTKAQQEKLPDWFGATANSSVSGLKGTYVIYVEAHRRAAQRKGVLPREMQSITWEAVRGLFLPSFKSNPNNVQRINDIWNNYRKGLIDIDQVRQEVMNEAGDQGRFRPPSWEGSDSGSLRSPELAINEGELSGAVVSRRTPRDYGRVGGEPARGDPLLIDEPTIGNLTKAETEQLGRVGEVIESLPKYSRRRATPPPEVLGFQQAERGVEAGIPVGNTFSTISAPKRFPDKNLQGFESLFGVIKDNGSPVPVLLFAGEHSFETGGGRGLSHILERGHEQELLDNSKFPDIETAIQQTFFAWAKQGHTDGPNVISEAGTVGGDRTRTVEGSFRSISKKDINLIWTNPSHGSPPFKVVMNYGIVEEPSVLQEFGFSRPIPVYSVTTAFPVLGLNERAKVSRSRRTAMAEPVPFRPPSYRSVDSQVEESDDAYQRITYNNMSKVIGNISKKFASDDRADEIQAYSERFLTKYQDAMLPIGKLMDELRSAGFSISDGLDTYMREELSHGVIGYKLETNTKNLFNKVKDIIKNIDISDSKVAELTEGKTPRSYFLRDAIKSSGKNLAIADAYMYALHAKERNQYVQDKFGRGLGSGMSNTEADAIINWVESLDADNLQLMFGVRDFVGRIIKSTNDARRDGGLMAEEYDFDFYVPLRGNLDPDEEIEQDSQNLARVYNRKQPDLYGGRKRQDPAIAAGRGTQYAEDIIATAMHQNQTSVINGERNKVGQSFLKLVQDENIDTKDFAEVVTEVPKRNEDNVLGVKVNGVKDPVKIFIYDDRIARAMKGAYGDGINRGGSVVRHLTTLNRYLSSINTTYNPEFLFTNFSRDLETAIINVNQYADVSGLDGMTKKITLGTPNAIRGIIDHIRREKRGENFDPDNKWSVIYQEFMENGGKNATNQIDTVEDQVRNIKNVLDEISSETAKGKLGNAKRLFVGKAGSLLSLIDDANTAVENGVRVATYNALKEAGFSKDRAAQAARNITVNFAKAGENRAMMNALYLFYNASVQGSFALYNTLIRSPRVRKLWGGMILFGILADQFNAFVSGDEDEDGKKDYDELSDYTLEHNIIIDTLGLTDEGYIKIPTAYGLNSAVNLGRAISRYQRGEYNVGQASSSIFGTLLESISPIGGVNEFDEIGDYFITAVPTVAEPAMSLFVNRDYDGSPIYKEGSQFGLQKPSSQTHWTTTSGLSKGFTKTLNDLTGGSEVTPGLANISPDVVDYIFGYLTGAAGSFAYRLASTPSNVVDALKDDYEGDLSRQLPFVRKLFTNPTAIEDVGVFIENRDKVLYAGKELQYARQLGDLERVERIRREYATELSIYGQLKALNNARNQLMRQRKKIENNPRIPDEQKEMLVKRYREKMNEIVKKANIILRNAGVK